MIKLRIKQSKHFIKELNNFNKQQWNDTKYSINNKKLNFRGAQNILDKAIKLLKPYNILNITYTESQPTVYDEKDDFYWTYTGQIYIETEYKTNSKTKRNLKTISSILNNVWGYEIILRNKNKDYRL